MTAENVEVRAPEVQKMFGSIAKTYDLVNTVLSGGVHHYWKRALNQMLPKQPEAVCLDLCSGTGALVPMLRRRYRSVVASDFCKPMLDISQEKYRDTHHVLGDALELGFREESFDVVTIAYGVRNFEDLRSGLDEVKRVLKSGGTLAILEFGQPEQGLWKLLFDFYSQTVMPTLGGLISGNKDAYTYLPKTSANFPCGESFVEILRELGFVNIQFRSLTGGIAYIYSCEAQASFGAFA